MDTIKSTAENVEWGNFDPNRNPVISVESGETVEIQTVTAPREKHLKLLEDSGIEREKILQDEVNIKNTVLKTGPHVVTGPIEIKGAKPGDALEVRVKDIEFRAPYGFNLFKPGGGVEEKKFPYQETHVIPFDIENNIAQFDDDTEIPLEPFLGIMAVSPHPEAGKTSTIPPGYFGGNLDLKQLGVDSRLYLPVNTEGALFWAGDGHGVQGNGEVCLTAAETSLTATLEFVIHKQNERLRWPIAETKNHYIIMGFDQNLDQAMSHAVNECVSFLSKQKQIDESDAYRLASLSVDFNVTQVVNNTKGIHAMIPKYLFNKNENDDIINIFD